MALSKRWQLSAFEYHVDFITVPALFALAIWLGPISIWQIVAGALLWSLMEYGIHRFLFHKYFRRDHWAHHVNPSEYIGISGLQVALAYLVALLPAYWLGLTSLYAGILIGYMAYITIHYVMHRPQSWLYRCIGMLIKNHDMHHQKGIEKNFGVTSPLWDWIFFSYAAPSSASAGKNPAHDKQK